MHGPASNGIVHRLALYATMLERFGDDDLDNLIFVLGLDHGDVPGDTRAARIRALIRECEQSNRYAELVTTARDLRPDAFPPARPYAASPISHHHRAHAGVQ